MAPMQDPDQLDPARLFCDRCQAEVHPGQGDFYVVRIEAFCDPTPPSFSKEDLLRDPRAQIQRLLEELRDVSAQEAMDQVYRRLSLYLCTACYRQWIENPAG
ncbi:MAG: hypothetical protein ACUVUC_00955 [Thermoguttaceae bacterium]